MVELLAGAASESVYLQPVQGMAVGRPAARRSLHLPPEEDPIVRVAGRRAWAGQVPHEPFVRWAGHAGRAIPKFVHTFVVSGGHDAPWLSMDRSPHDLPSLLTPDERRRHCVAS